VTIFVTIVYRGLTARLVTSKHFFKNKSEYKRNLGQIMILSCKKSHIAKVVYLKLPISCYVRLWYLNYYSFAYFSIYSFVMFQLCNTVVTDIKL